MKNILSKILNKIKPNTHNQLVHSINELPAETLEEILLFLDPESISAFAKTNKYHLSVIIGLLDHLFQKDSLKIPFRLLQLYSYFKEDKNILKQNSLEKKYKNSVENMTADDLIMLASKHPGMVTDEHLVWAILNTHDTKKINPKIFFPLLFDFKRWQKSEIEYKNSLKQREVFLIMFYAIHYFHLLNKPTSSYLITLRDAFDEFLQQWQQAEHHANDKIRKEYNQFIEDLDFLFRMRRHCITYSDVYCQAASVFQKLHSLLNNWRDNALPVNLSGIVLTCINGNSFDHCIFQNFNFSNAIIAGKISNSLIIDSNLNHVNLTLLELKDVSITRCKLSQVKFGSNVLDLQLENNVLIDCDCSNIAFSARTNNFYQYWLIDNKYVDCRFGKNILSVGYKFDEIFKIYFQHSVFRDADTFKIALSHFTEDHNACYPQGSYMIRDLFQRLLVELKLSTHSNKLKLEFMNEIKISILFKQYFPKITKFLEKLSPRDVELQMQFFKLKHELKESLKQQKAKPINNRPGSSTSL